MGGVGKYVTDPLGAWTADLKRSGTYGEANRIQQLKDDGTSEGLAKKKDDADAAIKAAASMEAEGVKPPAAAPDLTDKAIAQARMTQRFQGLKAKGYASSFLTGPSGTIANPKSLLGG